MSTAQRSKIVLSFRMVDYSSSLLKDLNSSSCVFSQGYQREQVKTLKRFLIALFDAPVNRLFRLPPHPGVGISLSSDCMNLFLKNLVFQVFLYLIKDN